MLATQFTMAMVFPGQGSQSLGMLRELSVQFPQVKHTFDEASEILGYNLWQLIQEDPNSLLDQTQYTQPALLAADIAVWRCWQSMSAPEPAVVAGHSLGEYSALVCAQALSFTDAIYLVSKRGHYMQHAVPEGIGAMAAIIGLDEVMVQSICQQIVRPGYVLSPANLNATKQIVIAGHAVLIDEAVNKAIALGAKLAKRIPVSVPSHCILMEQAAQALANDLKNMHINKPICQVIHNADVSSHDTPEAIRRALIMQLTQPVRWVETLEKLEHLGINLVVECGPGKVLSGLIRRTIPNMLVYASSDIAQFNCAIDAVMGAALCH